MQRPRLGSWVSLPFCEPLVPNSGGQMTPKTAASQCRDGEWGRGPLDLPLTSVPRREVALLFPTQETAGHMPDSSSACGLPGTLMATECNRTQATPTCCYYSPGGRRKEGEAQQNLGLCGWMLERQREGGILSPWTEVASLKCVHWSLSTLH